MGKFNKNYTPSDKVIIEELETELEERIPTKNFVVDTILLNVRKSPESNAPIIKTVTKGFKFEGTVLGDWIKIGEDEYVMKQFTKEA